MMSYRIIDNKKYDIEESILLFDFNWGFTKVYKSPAGFFSVHTPGGNLIGQEFRLLSREDVEGKYPWATTIHVPYEEMFEYPELK